MTPKVALLVVVAHGMLLGSNATQHSPTLNELGHVPAGICHLRFGSFELYRVNPPLPRMIAALPVVLCDPKTDWANYGLHPFARDEYPMGIRFARANGSKTFRLFKLARWACIPFSLIGAYVCYRWASELWGDSSALLALALWCFSPTILGHGALVMPDVPAAAMGVAASFLFWKWLRDPTWTAALCAGVALGLAQLCKTTMLVLVAVLPAIWFVSRAFDRMHGAASWKRQGAMIAFVSAVSVYVLNLGYGFTGSFERLGDYHFASRLLSGTPAERTPRDGNRFNGTFIGSLPVPLPRDYLQGLDRQRADFEAGGSSYLRGRWQSRGWWYYHLYALGVKTPVGVLLILGAAVVASLIWPEYRCGLAGELSLLLPAIAILTLVSAQTGFSNHMRYTIPAFPFLIIWMSRIARAVQLRHSGMTLFTLVCATWATVSSLAVFPHSISYFNELVGGPKNGHKHLLDSNVAWGQDLLYLRRWLDAHPEARPLHLAAFGWVDPRLAGIDFSLPLLGPNGPVSSRSSLSDSELGPRPGWYAIDVNFLHGTHWPAPNGNGGWRDIPTSGVNFEYFQRFAPVDRVAYSFHIYHIGLAEANRVRRELGLRELPDESATKVNESTDDGKT